ncbi:MAG: ABC transporter permease [Woeseiaceae bacterium]
MSWIKFALANLKLSPLTAGVNVLLMALGTASIVILLLAGAQLSDTMSRDARGIDLVIGAKGSPVQLVLATVYHADAPPGNIVLGDAERWVEDRRIAQAIPVSLGDSYRGFRIVGTTRDYGDLYDAELDTGQWWAQPMEAVVGASAAKASGLEVGTEFDGAHGFSDGGHAHDRTPYLVTGVLAPTGTVIDRLVLTSLESVWLLHGDEDHGAHDDHEHDAHEVTAFLLRYVSPMSAATMPRQINTSSNLLAAAPAMEVARVLKMVGVGLDGLRAFAWILILSAALSIFAALYGSLRSRRSDIAMLRCLGATRWELFFALLLEGLLLTALGVALGFVAGHVIVESLGSWLQGTRGLSFTGWIWLRTETALIFGLIAVGVMAAAIPAIQAYRTDVAKTLAEAP